MPHESMIARRVLVTGSAGTIGRAVCRELTRRGHAVRGFDRQPSQDLADHVVGDLADGPALIAAANGVDSLIHLAAYPTDADFVTQLVPHNVIGLYHACEAARLAGVRRLVLTSSCQVSSYLMAPGYLVQPGDRPAATSFYALTKVLAEEMGWMYHKASGLSVLIARPGWLPRTMDDARTLANSKAGPNHYLSPGDAGRFFALAIEADAIEFEVAFLTSKPKVKTTFDLTSARKLLGYEPQDTWPQGMETLEFFRAEEL